jgi:hypothetical protein
VLSSARAVAKFASASRRFRACVRCRFRNLRAKLPHLEGMVSYTYRHSFVTDALENGLGVAQFAELLGHLDRHGDAALPAPAREARPPQAGCHPGNAKECQAGGTGHQSRTTASTREALPETSPAYLSWETPKTQHRRHRA